ncbi:MAG: hypothetical protein QM621_02715 [Aeromicrobium sp.]|uniref:hypothetical protein n=1 Tax=Aeromicrobium sp. TaxID=1871063 RepID=UPI0039E61015
MSERTRTNERVNSAAPSLRFTLSWWAFSALAVLLIAATRVARTPKYFFWDDTQTGSFGQWYDVGRRVISGEWTILDPGSWQGGNFLAEQQWGLWSPLTWIVGAGSHLSDNPAIYATFVKIGFLLLLHSSTFGLARSYGVSAPWSAFAGVSSVTAGQTLYMDAPSWVTGLQGVSIFVLTWWMLRRHVEEGKNPLFYFLSAFLLITLGYIFAVITLVFLFAALILEALIVHRDKFRIFRIFLLGAYSGLLTIFVYLPGILTSSVTVRSGKGIQNDQFLNLDLGDLATSPAVTGLTSVTGYWGTIAPAPIQYLGWFIPLFVILAPQFRHHWRTLLVIIAICAMTLIMILGPSIVGPLRFPARMLPYVSVYLALAFAILATKSWPRSPTRAQLAWPLALTSLSLWLSWSAQPDNMRWLAIGGFLQLLSIILVLNIGPRMTVRHAASWSAGTAILATIVLLAVQTQLARTSPLPDFQIPTSTDQIRSVQNNIDSGVFTVGDIYAMKNDPSGWEETLIANVWHVTDLDAAGVYTVLPHRGLSQRLCADARGATCPEAYSRLFKERKDGSKLVDDMHINTVIVVRDGTTSEGDPITAPELHEGWEMQTGEHTWTVRRLNPLPPAGGITRTDGVSVSDVKVSNTEVSFTVDSVDQESNGSIVFSRIDWPGYRVTGANHVDPTDDYLLTVHVGSKQVGERVTISFRPPGWRLELLSGILALVTAGVWSTSHAIRNRQGDLFMRSSRKSAQ